MSNIRKSGDSGKQGAALTSHGVIILSTGVVLLLVWRGTNSGVFTMGVGIVLLLLVLKNYDTIISQLEEL